MSHVMNGVTWWFLYIQKIKVKKISKMCIRDSGVPEHAGILRKGDQILFIVPLLPGGSWLLGCLGSLCRLTGLPLCRTYWLVSNDRISRLAIIHDIGPFPVSAGEGFCVCQ